MDVAYNQHSSHARRSNRSSTNLNRLSLVPLTTKLPLSDHDDLYPEPRTAPLVPSTSYLQGKSAPTTPPLLSRSPVRSRSQTRRGGLTASTNLPKSKSTTHLARQRKTGHTGGIASGAVSPTYRRRSKDENGIAVSARDRSDSDWLLRAGALLSGECREFKGQAWLVSRASSTSLAGARDAEEVAFERELARGREYASHHHSSRRGSVVLAEDEMQSPGSRLGSLPHSRAGSRTQMLTPRERRLVDGYFASQELSSAYHQPHDVHDVYLHHEQHMTVGPDFVNLDEKLEAIEQDTSIEDEAHVRLLVKREQTGSGAGFWLGSVLGWRLFSVEENEEESDAETEVDGDDDRQDASGETTSDGDSSGPDDLLEKRRYQLRQLEGVTALPEERVAPPKADEGGWHDAAWLLSVASKVLL